MKKSKFKERFVDVLLELGVCFVCLVVGILILKIFKVDVLEGELSCELALIIGCIVVITLIVLCYTLYLRYKKKK